MWRRVTSVNKRFIKDKLGLSSFKIFKNSRATEISRPSVSDVNIVSGT